MIYAKVLKEAIEAELKAQNVKDASVTVTEGTDGIGGHHSPLNIVVNFPRLPGMMGNNAVVMRLRSVVTGCGVVTFSGYTGYISTSLNVYKIVFKVVADIYAKDGAGTMIATLGQSYYGKNVTGLETLGFKQVAEYPNLKHGSGYNQKLFVYIHGEQPVVSSTAVVAMAENIAIGIDSIAVNTVVAGTAVTAVHNDDEDLDIYDHGDDDYFEDDDW